MNGEERRKNIINIINSSSRPLSGSELARQLGVSRQVIVNDIALIRANNVDIISTHKGYIINTPIHCMREFKVNHPSSQFEDEMNTIIDAGGKILDISINHPVYGRITAQLEIYSRNDILKFKKKMQTDNAEPLCRITSVIHYHTVIAYSEQILDDVETALSERGYLIQ